jgi:hypothetical protein
MLVRPALVDFPLATNASAWSASVTSTSLFRKLSTFSVDLQVRLEDLLRRHGAMSPPWMCFAWSLDGGFSTSTSTIPR